MHTLAEKLARPSGQRTSSGGPGLSFGLTICGIPELDAHCNTRVTHVLSLLDPDFNEPPAFPALPQHCRLALRFHDVIEPRPDRIAPARADVERLLAFGRELVRTPDASLLVHCHAGVSRSTASAALILAQAWPDRPASDALEAVAALRPCAWPNLRILEFGDVLLGRNGEILAAVAAIYRRVLERDRPFSEALLKAGRFREIVAALPRQNLSYSLMSPIKP
jgi:predicted protein tyrosine phosphatase